MRMPLRQRRAARCSSKAAMASFSSVARSQPQFRSILHVLGAVARSTALLALWLFMGWPDREMLKSVISKIPG